ncbi:unnamed protein product [Moneuplotes crassus]|uniref:Uncharacterized protein n=1 Tax=Euplotes crassus TaxID=5936 RepID=A0AAD2D410_EUPCR|nr:unnamed protein product [Moneuplotes crassus]
MGGICSNYNYQTWSDTRDTQGDSYSIKPIQPRKQSSNNSTATDMIQSERTSNNQSKYEKVDFCLWTSTNSPPTADKKRFEELAKKKVKAALKIKGLKKQAASGRMYLALRR